MKFVGAMAGFMKLRVDRRIGVAADVRYDLIGSACRDCSSGVGEIISLLYISPSTKSRKEPIVHSSGSLLFQKSISVAISS